MPKISSHQETCLTVQLLHLRRLPLLLLFLLLLLLLFFLLLLLFFLLPLLFPLLLLRCLLLIPLPTPPLFFHSSPVLFLDFAAFGLPFARPPVRLVLGSLVPGH